MVNNTAILSQLKTDLDTVKYLGQYLDAILYHNNQIAIKMKVYQNEIKLIESRFEENLSKLQKIYCESESKSTSTVNEPQEIQDSNTTPMSKQNEPMSVKDAITFLRRSKVHLSDYGYYLCGSVEARYKALKEAMVTYPIEEILQKLRALIIVWSQNAADKIQNAENYLNHLRADFHTLQEEILKPKHT